jgi:hypothetical protein
MPVSSEAPTTQDYLAAYSGAVSARRTTADVHRGSRYDVLGGVGAVLFQRITTRDVDQFRATYFDTAQDTELDELEAKRYPDVPPRILAAKGKGFIQASRPSAAAGGGSFLAGTRVTVIYGAATPVRTFEISGPQTIGATALRAELIPIQAVEPGAGNPIDVSSSDVQQIRFEDPLWDNTWRVDHLTCGSGTDREKDADYRVRTRASRADSRIGYPTRIIAAMKAAGAQRVALFASDYLGEGLDRGLNRIYVGDTGYASSAALLRACRLATYSVCVLGTSAQVLPMAQQTLNLSADVELWDKADHISRDMLSADIASAISNYLASRQNPFVWSIDSMEGVALKAARQQAQAITVTASAAEPDLATLFDTFPLVAWFADPSKITVTFR